MRRRLISLGIAIAIVCVAFPEVLFLGGSLSPVGLNDTLRSGAPHHVVEVYPNLRSRAPADDVRDIGARVWQLVPATKFMHRVISKGDSPFWNPYSAAGSYGPETMADMKLSPFVLAVGALGASATAFTFVVLLFVALALYCMQQLVTFTLGLGRLAATAACFVWLLTGFGASDVNSATGAPYVLFPVLLYVLAAYLRRGGRLRFLAAVGAYVAFLLTTFVSTQLLVLVLVHLVLLVLDAPRWPGGQRVIERAATIARRHLVVPVVAFAVSAYVWLPNIVVIARGGSDFSKYGQRSLSQGGPLDSLKLLTPLPVGGGRWFGYIGIVPVLVVAGAWPRARGLRRRLLNVTAPVVLFALALHSGIVGVRLIGDLPGLRAIRQDYWAALAGAAGSIATGVSVAVVRDRGVSRAALSWAGALVLVWVGGAAAESALIGHAGIATLGVVAVIAVVVVAARLLWGAAGSDRARRRLIAGGVVLLIALELLAYQNHARLSRFDLERPAPRYAGFLLRNLHGDRILDAGRGGVYPEWGTVLGIPQVETENVAQLPAYRAFFHRYVEPSKGLFLELGSSRSKTFTAQPSALDLLSVRFIVVDGSMPKFDAAVKARYRRVFDDRRAGVQVYANPHPFPRAYLSPSLAGIPRGTAAGSFSTARTVSSDAELLHAARAAGIATSGSAPVRSAGTARITRSRNAEVRVDVDASRPAVLVLTDTYADGWHVTVDGRPQHLAPVDEVMRGVVIPAGAHTVVFGYSSHARSIGELVSLVALGLLLASVLGSAVTAAAGRRRVRGAAGSAATGAGC